MQVTEQQYGELEKVYTVIGAVVLALAGDGLETTRLRIAGFIREELAKTDEWPPDMKRVMLNAIDTLETYLARAATAAPCQKRTLANILC